MAILHVTFAFHPNKFSPQNMLDLVKPHEKTLSLHIASVMVVNSIKADLHDQLCLNRFNLLAIVIYQNADCDGH